MRPPAAQKARDHDRWILAQRADHDRNRLDPSRPYAFLLEQERAANHEVVPVATIFLTNRECPWHCLMCDLWRNTLRERIQPGLIPLQIDHALARLPPARQVKLYNNGSFFDPAAIPPADYPAIAQRMRPFDRVIVESHPALVGRRCLEFKRQLAGELEVAMGLETVHPAILPALNKRMTLDDFKRAACFLTGHNIAVRSFILVKPPYIMTEPEAIHWTKRSVDFALGCGATVATLIPTRLGNGAMEALAAQNQFAPPRLQTVETCLDYGIGLRRGRVFADLWDLEQFRDCPVCFSERKARLEQMNSRQTILPQVECPKCQAAS